MNPDEKVAYFVNWAGIFSFSLIIVLHLITVIAKQPDSPSKNKSD